MDRDWLIPYAVGIGLGVAVVIVGDVANWSGEAMGTAVMGVILVGLLIRSALVDGTAESQSPPPSEPH